MTPTASSTPALARAAGYLVRAAADGFAETAHTMPFPREQGFLVDADTQTGDVFQRAILADVLARLGRRDPRLGPLVQRELDYLIEVRRRYRPGGWSYFPGLDELPSDADDLAQVMQAFLLGGRREAVAAYCLEPLAVLLDDCSQAPGVFETWIVPRDRTALHQRQVWWIEHGWGTGPDPEVIANLLYALAAYDEAHFREVIDGGARFVAEQQGADGLWSATWYHGPFYGTYLCTRLLDGRHNASVRRARAALLECQRPDGGWGWADRSEALSTAFALMSFGAGFGTPAADPTWRDAIDRARAYLLATQSEDGGWDGVLWIKMELGRAEGAVRSVLSYGSHVITTALAARALLQFDREDGR
jgi:squalene-hopene/tetraprenyl-beta-curcumene cyclase